MAHDFSLFQVILKGGWTIVLLLLMSILVFAVLFERWKAFCRASKTRLADLLSTLGSVMSGKDASAGLKLCEEDGSFLARVATAGFRARLERQTVQSAMDREARARLLELETRLPILGTIGGIAPFVGLFGTVLGIIRAFRDLALANAGGAAVVSQGIAEALVATAAGLFVAITAVIIFNTFQSKVERLSREAELLISEMSEKLA